MVNIANALYRWILYRQNILKVKSLWQKNNSDSLPIYADFILWYQVQIRAKNSVLITLINEGSGKTHTRKRDSTLCLRIA